MPRGPRSAVRNAGDPKQVRRAARSEADREARFREGLAHVMSSSHGRAFLWGLLGRSRVYESVWHEHGQRMAMNVGRQDFGHEIMVEMLEIDEDLYQMMEREGRAWQRRDDSADATAEQDTQQE